MDFKFWTNTKVFGYGDAEEDLNRQWKLSHALLVIYKSDESAAQMREICEPFWTLFGGRHIFGAINARPKTSYNGGNRKEGAFHVA